MALLQIDTETKTAELYSPEEAWHIERKINSPERWEVIGPEPAHEFSSLADLLNAKLPDLVKWAARGLAGLPVEEAPNG